MANAMSVLPLSGPAKPPRGREPQEIAVSHLGHALRVKGVLETAGELVVAGTVRGRINAARVVLGPGALVEGDVVAREVRVAGRFDGRIFAVNVTVDATADITGRIFHNTIAVERGARIDGRMPWRPPNYFDSLDQLPETRP